MKNLHPRFAYHDDEDTETFFKIISGVRPDSVEVSTEDGHEPEGLSRQEFSDSLVNVVGAVVSLAEAIKNQKPPNIYVSPQVEVKAQFPPSRKVIQRNSMGQIIEVRDEPTSE